MAGACASCGLSGVENYKWPLVDNIKRDPFEGSVGDEMKTLLGQGGALAGPVTAYIYDWNILPIGQILWLKELESYGQLPADAGPGELQPGPGHPADQEPADDRSRKRLGQTLLTAKRAARKGRPSCQTSFMPSATEKANMPTSRPSRPRSRRFMLGALAAMPMAPALLAATQAQAQTAPAAVLERRPGEAGDPRFRARPRPIQAARSSCRLGSASPRSTRTARCGSSTRCTRR